MHRDPTAFVEALWQNPQSVSLVESAYWDKDVQIAASRYHRSDEFKELCALLAKYLPGSKHLILELGAGRGIAAFAFASEGHTVVGIEPDPSHVLGAGAFAALARTSHLPIGCIRAWGEALPINGSSVSVVFTRQMLHHARDLDQVAREIYRVTAPEAVVIAAREHVLNSETELELFLESHDTHKFLGNEHAFTMREYVGAFEAAGFVTEQILGTFDSAINYFPRSTSDQKRLLSEIPTRTWKGWGRFLVWSAAFRRYALSRAIDQQNRVPGRLCTFVFRKTPCR